MRHVTALMLLAFFVVNSTIFFVFYVQRRSEVVKARAQDNIRDAHLLSHNRTCGMELDDRATFEVNEKGWDIPIDTGFVSGDGFLYFLTETPRRCWYNKFGKPQHKIASKEFEKYFGVHFVAQLDRCQPKYICSKLPRHMFTVCRRTLPVMAQPGPGGNIQLLIACPLSIEHQEIFLAEPYAILNVTLHYVGGRSDPFSRMQYTSLPLEYKTTLGLPQDTISSRTYSVCRVAADRHFVADTSAMRAIAQRSLEPIRPKLILAACVYIASVTASRFVEWVEFHILQGFQHFFFYHQSPLVQTSLVAKILRGYVKSGIASIHLWPHGYSPGCDFGHGGGVVLGNVCMRKHSSSARWLALFDVDEFIVSPPRYPAGCMNGEKRFDEGKLRSVKSTVEAMERDDWHDMLCGPTLCGKLPLFGRFQSRCKQKKPISGLILRSILAGPCANQLTVNNTTKYPLRLTENRCFDVPSNKIIPPSGSPKGIWKTDVGFSHWVHFMDIYPNNTMVANIFEHDIFLIHQRRTAASNAILHENYFVSNLLEFWREELFRNVKRYVDRNHLDLRSLKDKEDQFDQRNRQGNGRDAYRAPDLFHNSSSM